MHSGTASINAAVKSFDSVTNMKQGAAATGPAAGDYFVWNNAVWSFDEDEMNKPLPEICKILNEYLDKMPRKRRV